MPFEVGDFVVLRRKPERELFGYDRSRKSRLFMISGVGKLYVQIIDPLTLMPAFQARVFAGKRQKGSPPNYWYRVDLFKRR